MVNIFTKGYRQRISFYDKGYQRIVYREIVYPISDKPEDIYSYFLKSISSNSIICVDEKKECFYYLSENDHILKTGMIGNYWIDGEIYLIDYIRANNNYFFIWANNSDLNNLEYKRILNSIVKNNKINSIDELNKCWIKKVDTYCCEKTK